MRATKRARPFLKWAGGKQGLAASLVRRFPRSFRKFYDPFLGGGSIFFALRPKTAVVGDLNAWLVDCYAAIRTDWERVASILDTLTNTREDYLRIRALCPEELDLYHRAAHLIYLNKTCFRGLFRVNRKGQFNVPYGEYDRRYYSPPELAAAAVAMRDVEIRTADFEVCIADVAEGDFVYLDPPYYKLGGYSDFNRYTRYQFRENDHIRLAAVCRELDERKVLWAVSNSDTPFVRNLFEGYCMLPITNRREINLNSQNRDIRELLIINYSEPAPEDDLPLFRGLCDQGDSTTG